MVFLLIGGALGLLYAARTILSARSENRTPTFIDQLVVLAMVGVLAFAVVLDNQITNQLDTLEFGVAALGLVFALFGLMALLLGRRDGNSDDARGWLSIGIGLIIVAVAFFVPQFNQVAPSPDDVAFIVPTAVNDVASVPSTNGLGDQRFVSNRTMQLAPTQTPVELSQTIPSPEPPALIFFTPTPTPEGLACSGVIETNLNLRKYPSVAEGNIVGLAPVDKTVSIIGRNQATSWYYITFDIYEGWVDANFVDADEACETIPTRAWAE